MSSFVQEDGEAVVFDLQRQHAREAQKMPWSEQNSPRAVKKCPAHAGRAACPGAGGLVQAGSMCGQVLQRDKQLQWPPLPRGHHGPHSATSGSGATSMYSFYKYVTPLPRENLQTGGSRAGVIG